MRADPPDSVADTPRDGSVRYREGAVTALGAALVTLGVSRGERVLILMPAGPGFAAAIVGTIRHGALPLPMNPGTWTSDLVTAATKIGSRLVVVSTEHTSALAELPALQKVPVGGEQGIWATVLSLDLNQPVPPAG